LKFFVINFSLKGQPVICSMEWAAASAAARVQGAASALSPTTRKLTYNAGKGIVPSAGLYIPTHNDPDPLRFDYEDLNGNRRLDRRLGLANDRAAKLARKLVEHDARQKEIAIEFRELSRMQSELQSHADEMAKTGADQLQATRDFVAAQAHDSRIAHDGYRQGRKDGEYRAMRLIESQQRAARAHDDAAALRRRASESRNVLRLQHAQGLIYDCATITQPAEAIPPTQIQPQPLQSSPPMEGTASAQKRQRQNASQQKAFACEKRPFKLRSLPKCPTQRQKKTHAKLKADFAAFGRK
jgi:hypothetical protein